MKRRHKMFAAIMIVVIGLSAFTLFIMDAFQENMVFFYSPSDVLAGKSPANKTFRLGGMVEKGSVKKSTKGLQVEFVITDSSKTIAVIYEGILPDLFREGQGVITQGKLGKDNVFAATEVLAKHDENYMPPEVADAMKRAKENKVKYDKKI